MENMICCRPWFIPLQVSFIFLRVASNNLCLQFYDGCCETFTREKFCNQRVPRTTFTPHTIDNILGTNSFDQQQTSFSKKRREVKSEEKKTRTSFSPTQISRLEDDFLKKKYLSSAERLELANDLGLTQQQVKIWFQNRRTKWKKVDNISNEEAAKIMKLKLGGTKGFKI